MSSAIDPTRPVDGIAASKADLRSNLQAAKEEIEALQAARIAAAGLAGQVLAKASAADYDTQWIDPTAGGPALLDDLDDVDTTSAPPNPGQALVWDAALGLWKPGSAGAHTTETVFLPVTVVNPDAEAGNLAGWTTEAGTWSAVTSVGAMTAAHGGSFFIYNESPSDGTLGQVVDLIATGFTPQQLDGGALFRFIAWMGAAFQNDTGVLEIEWLDAAGSPIASNSTGERGPTNPLGTWEQVTLPGTVPIGTRKCRLKLETVNHFGFNSTYCFDDLTFEIGVQQEVELALDHLADVDTTSTPPTAGDALVFDGTFWTPAARAVEIAGSLQGAPAASQVALRYVAARALHLPVDLAGSRAVAGSAASAQADFEVQRNGAGIGLMRFAAGAAVASFSAGAATVMSAGDVLTLVAPGSPDASLADLAFTLLATL